MSKINTKNLICCRVQENTHDNLCKAIRALNFIENDEFYYNYELSSVANEFKDKLVDVLFEVDKEVNKHKSIFDKE